MKKIYFNIIIMLFLLIGLTSCKKECEHKYDYDCDTICNLCSEERSIEKHNFTPATCDAPKTCKDCGLTEGEKLAHVPDQDDGDCTTKIHCSLCDEVLIESLEHVYDEEYKYDNTAHWKECINDNCNHTIENIEHTYEDDDDCTTSLNCLTCNFVIAEAKEKHEDKDVDGICDNCSYKFDYIFDESTNTYFVYTATGLYEWERNSWKGVNLTLVKDIILPTEMNFDLDNDGVMESNWSNTRTSCTIEGNGYAIKGLVLKSTANKDFQGFIGSLDAGGVIKNLRFENVDINLVGINIGVIAATSRGIIENCSVSGNVNVDGNFVGGIVGLNSGMVVGCYNEATIFATSGHSGGIVGQNQDEGSIIGCFNLGSINANGDSIGGIVGVIYGGKVEGNYNTGTVIGDYHIGFIVGYNFLSDELDNNYSVMSVEEIQRETPSICVIVDGTEVTWNNAKEEMNKVLAELQVEWRYIINEGEDSSIRPLLVTKA